MALISCGECGKQVSDKAPTCPGCGAPIADDGLAKYSTPEAPAKKKGSVLDKNIGCLPIIVIGFVAAMVWGAIDRDEPAPTVERPERVGYLKDKVNNRIFTYAFPATMTSAAIRGHAMNLPNTPGQMVAAYYFPAGSVIAADGVTLAKTVIEANRTLYETPGLSRWRYAFMRNFNGSVSFVDCEADATNELCRQ